VLYELLTGQAPFQADTVHGVMYQTMHATAPTPSAIKSGIPRILDFIVAKALAKLPETRYQSARELADDLRASLQARGSGELEQQMLARLHEPEAVAPALPVGDARDEEKTARMRASAEDPAEELPLKAVAPSASFMLSGDFDSTEATMRLATLSGLASEFDAMAKAAAERGDGTMPGATNATIHPSRSTRLAPWLWVVAGASASIAAYLLLH